MKNSTNTAPFLRNHYDFLWETLELSGHLLKKRFGDPLEVKFKADRSLVTDADLASERLILDRIRQYFSADLIISEESPMPKEERRRGQGVWVIDPLDGTTNFANHYPHFGVSIAYGLISDDGTIDVQVGGVIHPMQGSLFLAHKSYGAQCNGVPMRVSQQENFDRAYLVTGFYYNKGGTLEMDVRRFAHVVDQCQSVRGDGSATLDFCYVAKGVFDGFWEHGLQPWDVAAGALIVQEAGGIVYNYSPSQTQVYHPEGVGIIAGSEAVAKRLHHLITSAPQSLIVEKEGFDHV